MTATTDRFNGIPAGYELDRLVAEKVMGETEPTFQHELAHLDPEKSAGGDWVCWPEYERGDVCEWTPLPFSTDLTAAWKVVDRFVPWVCRFKSADGFIHLSCGHWADHGRCVDYAWTQEEEGLEDDPQPWSFHILRARPHGCVGYLPGRAESHSRYGCLRRMRHFGFSNRYRVFHGCRQVALHGCWVACDRCDFGGTSNADPSTRGSEWQACEAEFHEQ